MKAASSGRLDGPERKCVQACEHAGGSSNDAALACNACSSKPQQLLLPTRILQVKQLLLPLLMTAIHRRSLFADRRQEMWW
jgi:hypothetical protein